MCKIALVPKQHFRLWKQRTTHHLFRHWTEPKSVTTVQCHLLCLFLFEFQRMKEKFEISYSRDVILNMLSTYLENVRQIKRIRTQELCFCELHRTALSEYLIISKLCVFWGLVRSMFNKPRTYFRLSGFPSQHCPSWITLTMKLIFSCLHFLYFQIDRCDLACSKFLYC